MYLLVNSKSESESIAGFMCYALIFKGVLYPVCISSIVNKYEVINASSV